MGVLRFLLALAVVCAHTPLGFQLTGGKVAVQTFFIISGFYISLILKSTYKKKSLFWSNRLLRLLPTYYVVAIATYISVIFFDVKLYGRFENFELLPGLAQLFLIATNGLLVLQDVTMFLGVEGDDLRFVTNFENSSPPLFHFLLVPQAWSLGIELSFYLIAPFVLKWSTRALVLLLSASLFVRICLVAAGLTNDPWNYRFFPAELAFFLAGAISHRFYEMYRHQLQIVGRRLAISIVASIWVFTAIFAHIPVGKTALMITYYILVVVSLPIIFATSRNSIVDKHIGELSYPIYICHMLVISALDAIWDGPLTRMFGILSCIATIGLSIVIYHFVDKPIGEIRDKRKLVASGSLTPKFAGE